MSKNISITFNDVFVTRLFTFNLELSEHHPAWLDYIAQRQASEPVTEKMNRSNYNGWKTPFDLFDEPLFAPLQRLSKQCFQYVFEQHQQQAQAEHFDVQGSVNLSHPQAFNYQHGHAMSLYSGVYYLTVPENSGDIVFHEPRPAAKYSRLQADGCRFGSGDVYIAPKAGQLVLFPCWLEHSVLPNESDQTRISIPMNAMERTLSPVLPKKN